MVRAAERTTAAAKEVARVTAGADRTEDNATVAAPAGPHRSGDEFATQRSLKPDNVPVPLFKRRRVCHSLSAFQIQERLVLIVLAAATTAFFIIATWPGSWNLWTNQRTADTSSPYPQLPARSVESTATQALSPAQTPTAVDHGAASSSPVRQLDRDEVNMLVNRGEELMMTRDVATARLMPQRAAEAGDPRASSAQPTIQLNWNASVYAEVPSRALCPDLVRKSETIWLGRSTPTT